MLRRVCAAILISTCGIGLETPSSGADLARLPPDQQQAAKCILDVVGHERGVTNLSIDMIEDHDFGGGVQLFLIYTWRPQSHYLHGKNSTRLDVTELVTKKREFIVVGGVITAPHTSLNDIDNDIFKISAKLREKCGLDLDGVTE